MIVTRTKGQVESRRHEERLAKAVGGRRVPASGAFWSQKGDVRSADLLIEHKWTGKLTLTLKAQVLEKIMTEAVLEGRTPVLGVYLNGKNYVVLDEEDFLDLRRRLAHEEERAGLETTGELPGSGYGEVLPAPG
jgi:Holliday junction resolvase